jgi:uncharacterized membrane protein YqjE
MSERLKERVDEGAEQVQQKASEAKVKTREQLRQQVDSRSTQAGEQMTKTGSALRQTAQQLRGEQQEQQAKILEGVAERTDRFGRYLTETDGDRMLRDSGRGWWRAASHCSVSSRHGSRRRPAVGGTRLTETARIGSRGRSSQEAIPVAASSGSHTDDLHDRPIGELLKELANETTTLVRQELDLAKAEMREKAGKAGPGLGMWGAAGVMGLLALGSLTAFLILALDGAMPNWLAALIVGLVYSAIAGVLYARGKHRVEEAGSPVPEKTIETVKEDVQWAKHPTTSAKT